LILFQPLPLDFKASGHNCGFDRRFGGVVFCATC
jgi:hypothetical protein